MVKELRMIAVGLVAVLAISFSFAGCAQSTPKVEPTSGTTSVVAKKDIKIGYISKLLTHPWFMQESAGLDKKCKDLGIQYVAIDANLKDEQCLAAIDNLISQKVDGIAICATNQGLGPVIAKKCKDAGIALCTIDDSMKDESGKQIPHVGMPTKEMGMMGGEALAKLARDKGFFKAGNVVKVMNIDCETLAVFHDRILGYNDALKAACPELKDGDFINQSTKDTAFEDSLRVASAILNSHPEVTHWIVTGGNDDGALAALKIFGEAKFNISNVVACGLGGYELSLAEFKKGNTSYICIALQPDVEGEKAVEMLYNNIVNKKEMQQNTFVSGEIATVANYLEFFPGGKMKY